MTDGRRTTRHDKNSSGLMSDEVKHDKTEREQKVNILSAQKNQCIQCIHFGELSDISVYSSLG